MIANTIKTFVVMFIYSVSFFSFYIQLLEF